MLKTNDRYTVKIEGNTIMGAGVAKVDSIAVFVAGAVAGDVCKVRITDVKKSYAYAEVEAYEEMSGKRCSSGCAVFPRCGGCAMRHMDYAYEASVKEDAVKSALSKFGIRYGKLNRIVMPCPDGYRNKVTYRFDRDGEACFYSAESHNTVKLPEGGCRVCPDVFSKIAARMTDVIAEKKLTPPDEVMFRISHAGEINVALTGKLSDAETGDYVMALCSYFGDITGIVTRATAKDRYRAVMGEKHITTELMGLTFRVSPEAFFQVNYDGAEKLFGEVVRLAEKTPFTSCADLYCGTGTIGMILASRFKEARFTGVEINREAVADAKYNAKINGLSNVDFYCGDAAGYAASESPELVVVDPPRKGLSAEMLEVLRDTGAETVIYVSCNPFTLARDLKWLTDNGYSVDEVTAVNMFPRCEHVEVVVSLTR